MRWPRNPNLNLEEVCLSVQDVAADAIYVNTKHKRNT